MSMTDVSGGVGTRGLGRFTAGLISIITVTALSFSLALGGATQYLPYNDLATRLLSIATATLAVGLFNLMYRKGKRVYGLIGSVVAIIVAVTSLMLAYNSYQGFERQQRKDLETALARIELGAQGFGVLEVDLDHHLAKLSVDDCYIQARIEIRPINVANHGRIDRLKIWRPVMEQFGRRIVITPAAVPGYCGRRYRPGPYPQPLRA